MVAKRKRKTAKRKTNRAIVIGLFVGIGVLVLVLIGLVMFNFGFFENHEPEFFSVKDECSLIMGNLVHQIRDDGECRIRCVNECDVRDMDFVKFEYEGKDNDCNSCGCWCN